VLDFVEEALDEIALAILTEAEAAPSSARPFCRAELKKIAHTVSPYLSLHFAENRGLWRS